MWKHVAPVLELLPASNFKGARSLSMPIKIHLSPKGGVAAPIQHSTLRNVFFTRYLYGNSRTGHETVHLSHCALETFTRFSGENGYRPTEYLQKSALEIWGFGYIGRL